MYLMYELSGLGYDEIAAVMGQENYATVVRNIDRIARDVKKNERLRNEILNIAENLKSGSV